MHGFEPLLSWPANKSVIRQIEFKSMPGRIHQENDNESSSHPTKNPDVSDSSKAGTPGTRRPLKVSLIFDEAASARAAEISIKRILSHFEYKVQSFAFHELDPPGPGFRAARNVSDTDILMVAVHDNRPLPKPMQFWLGLCLSLRKGNQTGLLVSLIVNATEAVDPHSPLLDYLKALAALGGMTFLLHRTGDYRFPGSIDTPVDQRQPFSPT